MNTIHAVSSFVQVPAYDGDVNDVAARKNFRARAIASAIDTVIKDMTAKVGQLCDKHNLEGVSISTPNVALIGDDVIVGTIAGVFTNGQPTGLPPEIDRVIERVDSVGGSISVERKLPTDNQPSSSQQSGDAADDDAARRYLERAVASMRGGAPADPRIVEQFIASAGIPASPIPQPVAGNGNTGPKPNMSGIFEL